MTLDKKKAVVALGAEVGLGALYRAWLRRPILTWGATEAEATARLPGDELLENADGVSTRSIDIYAPGSAVWPWLAHMGPSPRGVAYTYDLDRESVGPERAQRRRGPAAVSAPGGW